LIALTAPPHLPTLSLHDALPICVFNLLGEPIDGRGPVTAKEYRPIHHAPPPFSDLSAKTELFETGIKVIDLLTPLVRGGKAGLLDRKSTRLNSSHLGISYAVFCL